MGMFGTCLNGVQVLFSELGSDVRIFQAKMIPGPSMLAPKTELETTRGMSLGHQPTNIYQNHPVRVVYRPP